MRILLANTHQAPAMVGGAEAAVESLAAGLAAAGHAVGIVSTDAGADEPGPPARFRRPGLNLYAADGPVRPGRLQRLRWHWRDGRNRAAGRAFAQVLEAFRPDVVHTHNLTGFGPLAWAACRAKGVPVVHTLHDYALLCAKTTTYRDGASCARPCMECRVLSARKRRFQDVPAIVTAPSDAVLALHRAWGWFADTPSRTVPNVLPLERLGRARAGPARRFGYLGRLDPSKGPGLFVEAAAKCTAPGLQFTVAGRGAPAFEAALRAQAEQAGVAVLGFVPDRQALLDGLDVLVVPSLWRDVAPMVVREAFAAGVPVVAAQVGGLPEMVPEACGWTVPPGDAVALAAAIDRIAQDPAGYAARSRAALERAAAEPAGRTVAAYVAAYQEALA